MDPTKTVVRRHQHDLTTAQERTPADCVSQQQSDLRTLLNSELLAHIVPSSSTCRVVLDLLPLILFCQFGCLMLFSLCWFSVMSPPDTYAYRTAACSSAQFPSSIRTSHAPRSTRALFLAWTRCLSDCLCMHSSFLVRSRYSSFYGFVARPCDGNAAQPAKTSSVSASFDVRRKDDEIFWVNLWRSFYHNSRQW